MGGNRLRRLARERQTAAFVAIAYAFSWGVWAIGYLVVPDDAPFVPVVLLGVFGPALAAVLTVRLRGESPRSWLGTVLRWRVGLRWYAAALLVPVAVYGLAAALLVTAGASVRGDRLTRGLTLFLGGLPAATLVTGGNEELGRRGFLLPRLQQRYDALTAGILVGVVWTVWHLPVYLLPLGLTNGPFSLFVPFAVLSSVVLTWLFNNTDGSVFLAMSMHGSINSAVGIFVGVLSVESVGGTVLWGSRIIGALCVAGALTLLYGRETLAGGDSEMDSTGAVRPVAPTDETQRGNYRPRATVKIYRRRATKALMTAIPLW